MNQKIPVVNKAAALLLSIIFAVSLFLSFFALPVELVFFNTQSYYTLLEKEEYSDVFPGILSQAVVIQASESSELYKNELITNLDSISSIISHKIPDEMVQSTFNEVIDQMFAYLNFKIPTTDMKIDIAELKAFLTSESQDIALEYLDSLPNCSSSDVEGLDESAELTAADLPACQPTGKTLGLFETAWAKAFEDIFNSLPASISLSKVVSLEQNLSDRSFTYYSMMRWAFRMLPIISIILLTFTAVLLRKKRSVMWRWCGRLLVIVCAITLIGLVILLIGFDQFVAMLLNPFLKNLVTGFGYVLLGAVQDVGFQMLTWVLISALIVMGFGILLMLIAKYTPEKPPEIPAEPQPEVAEEVIPEVVEEEPVPQKTVTPETLEEVEEKEKKRRKNKKTDEE